MPIKRVGKISNQGNEAILMALAKGGSLEYQARIPEATKRGMAQTLDTLTEFRPLWNEFVAGLIGRIGKVIVRSNSWSNPLKRFKKGLLQNGEQIQEIQHGLIKARVVSNARAGMEADIFGYSSPYVESNFHHRNHQVMYPITVNDDALKQAFLEDNGISRFLSGLMAVPLTSDEHDEFLLMTRLLKEYEERDGFFKVHIESISGDKPAEADVKEFLRRVKEYKAKLMFISTLYNPANMPVASPDDFVLFITPEANSAVDVYALAAAFNVKFEEVPYRVVVIPRENMPNDKCQAILTTTDFFQVYDTMLESTSMFNPANVTTNYFYHHRGIFSASRFIPAIMFTSDVGTVVVKTKDIVVKTIGGFHLYDAAGKDLDWSSGKLQKGMLYQAAVEAPTYEDPQPTEEELESADIGWKWEIDGAKSNKTAFMYDGVLRIGSDESAEKLTVRVTDPSGKVKSEHEFPVAGASVPKPFKKAE